jgi:hypothetical protein
MASSTDDYLIRGGEIVDRCRELDRIIARAEAEKAALLGERVDRLLAEVPPGSAGYEAAERSMFAEISAALHITRGAAARALGIGWALQTRFPQTRAALASGEISARHAATIVTAAAPFDLSDADAHQRFEQQVVPFAGAETAAGPRRSPGPSPRLYHPRPSWSATAAPAATGASPSRISMTG